MFMPLIFILFGGLTTHIIESGTLYSQCYDKDNNLKVEMCSHTDIQDFNRKIENFKK